MRYLLSLTLILLLQHTCFAQDTAWVKFRLTTTPTQYVFLDFPVTIEKVYKRHTLGLTFGFRPATQSSGEPTIAGSGLFGYYIDQNFFNKLYNATTIGISSKYYLSDNNSLFVEGDLFFRYWWYNRKNVELRSNDPVYEFDGIRTEDQNVLGLKVLLGNSYEIKTKTRIKPVIDLYMGLGVRYKVYSFETFDGTVDDKYYSVRNETGQLVNSASGAMPFSFQLGVKIGIANY